MMITANSKRKPGRSQLAGFWSDNIARTLLLSLTFAVLTGWAYGAEPLQFRSLFDGKTLDGWVDVNTSPETWRAEDGLLKCRGTPIGVMRSDRQYENFILEIEWMHLESGGNSGVFVWSEGEVHTANRLPSGVEVQMLENDYPIIHNRVREYVSGELFGAGTVTTVPDYPRGKRSSSVEYRCKGKGEWNHYLVVCVDGVVKLAINGKFVNGVRESSVKKGYLCLESEGAEIHFRNIRIMELPPGVIKESEIAPLVGE